MDKLLYKYQEYRADAELEASPTNDAARGILDKMRDAARTAGIIGPETPSVMSPTGDLGKMPEAPKEPVAIRASTPQETQKAKAAPTAQESYDPSQAGLVESSAQAAKSQGAQALGNTYAGAADFYGTLDSLAGIVSRKAGMGKPEVFDYLKRSSEYWAEHYHSKVSVDDYMTRVVGGVLGSGPALTEFSMGPVWAGLKGYAQDENLADALYSAGRRAAAGAVFKSAHTLDAPARIGAGTAYMTGESVADQLGRTGTVNASETAEAAGVGLGMMLSGGFGPGNKTGMRQRVNPETWFETSKQGNEIYKALDEGRIDPLTKDLAKEFYTADLMRGGTALNDTSMAVIDKVNLIKRGVDDWILAEQGIAPADGVDYVITGKTTTRQVGPQEYKTAIELYQGANPGTLVEEWMHRDHERLPASEKRAISRAYDAYKGGIAEGEPVMSEAEFYAKGATDNFFADRVAATKAPMRAAWSKAVDNAKSRWEGFVDAIKGVPGAKAAGEAPEAMDGTQAAYKTSERMQVRPIDDIIYDPTPAPKLDQKYAEGGNTNLQRINSTEDVLKLINDVSRHNRETGAFEQATRGVRTWEETDKAARESETRVSDLLFRKEGQAGNAEQLLAARQLQAEFAAQTAGLIARAKQTGEQADKDAAAKAWGVFSAVTAARDGMAAEAGRALNIMGRPVGDVRTQLISTAFADLARKHGGDRNADAIMDSILDMSRLNADGKLDIEEIARFARKIEKASTFDMILEARYMAMLANPATHIKNTLGNSIALMSQIPERAVAEGMGAVRGLFSKGAIDRVEAGETLAMMYGGIEGLRAGATAFARAVRTGESTDPLGKLETTRRAITAENMGVDSESAFGKMIDFTAERLRTGNMLLGAEDDFFKAVGYSMELNARAHRAASAEGLKGQEFADRIQALVTNPPWDMQMQAMDFAHYSTFTNALGEGLTKLQGALGTDKTVTLKSGKTYDVPTGKLFRLAVPFFRTPANIVSYGMKRSPFAPFMPSVQQDLINGGAARDMAISRIALGSTLGFMAAQAASAGLITGGGPSDPKQKENKKAVGWQPYSVKVGDKWMSYQSMEPFSMIIGAAADIALFDDYLEDNERNNAATMVAGAFSQAVTSKTFMQGLAGMIDVLQDPDRYGDRYAQQFAASFIPSPVKAIRRDVDPNVREVWTVTDALKNALPGYSGDLYPRRNRYGEVVTMGEVWLTNTLDPVRKSEIKNAENSPTYAIDKAIMENNVPIPRPGKVLHWEGVKVELTPEEYDTFQMLPRDLGLVEALQNVVASETFTAASGGPDGIKSNMIREVFGDFREQARYELVTRSQGVPGGIAERIEIEKLQTKMKQEAQQ